MSPNKISFISNETMTSLHKYQSILLVFGGTVLTGWLYNKYWVNRRYLSTNQLMNGKTILITGGNTGIGYETAKDLLKRNARVVIACRNLVKGREAIENLLKETNCSKTNLRLMECDLSSLNSVRKFAKLFNEEENHLDVLICNAGLGYSPQKQTEDGFDSVIQSNYLSHFLLTNLLLDKLKKSESARIINVSSDLHRLVTKPIDWSDAFTQRNSLGMMGSYPVSKLFQILSSYQFKTNLSDDEHVNVFCLTPGFVSTSIKDPLEEKIGSLLSLIYYPIMCISKWVFAKTAQCGAQTSIYCAVEPSLDRSKSLYFQNCAVCPSSPLSIDPESARKLWDLSCQAVGL
ncbi:unnamed protein product [Adineta ricciae]|uniref:Uncharacterized protein n=1 Tax=Adineta ricciae TaxID=249248 RepID=A0A815QUU9_ADIRI|nr:unnamed protein product [Adineta ricciae]